MAFNMDPKKCPMPTQDPNVRNKNFEEVALGYTEEMAVNEAKRCIHCKNKPCQTGCPVGIDIPEFIGHVAEGDFEAAYQVIARSSSLPAVCGRVCPQESQCEGKCTRGIKNEPVGIGRLERFVADWHRENVHTAPIVPAWNGHKVAIIGAGPAGLTAAFELLRESRPEARLIIAPRHPERAEAVASLVPEKYKTMRLSALAEGWDVLIIDKIGVLFDLYGTAYSAFVGGSFADKGGQNILEPFSWDVPVQYGPHMEDFAQASRAFISMGAAAQVADERELAEVWLSLAAERDTGERWQRLSRDYFEKSCGASMRTWQMIKKYLSGYG